MPAVVIEDDSTTVELSAFNGTWVLDKAFIGDNYVDNETLATITGITVPTIRIEDGKLYFLSEDGNGGTTEKEYACAFEAGQLQGEDEGVTYCFDTLEDGNIVMSMFVPGENEEVICISLFLVHPAE